MNGSEAGPGRGQCGFSSLVGGAGTVGASLSEVHGDTGATRRPRRRRKSRSPPGQGGEAVCSRAVPAAGQGAGHACPRGAGRMPASVLPGPGRKAGGKGDRRGC